MEAPSLDELPEDVLTVLVSLLRYKELCSLGGCCHRFNKLTSAPEVWARSYLQRWHVPAASHASDQLLPPAPAIGWRADYVRRHAQEKSIMQLLGKLETSEGEKAWTSLMKMGAEAFEFLSAKCNDVPDAPGMEHVRDRRMTTLVALNQTIVKDEWDALMEHATIIPPYTPFSAGHEVHVEDGALLLVRFYLTAEEVRTGAAHSTLEAVRSELDRMADALRHSLHSSEHSQPYTDLQVVSELNRLMFTTEAWSPIGGWRGNQDNYYDRNNSLLSHVLEARTGIPITLAIVYAAVCRRVGVELSMIGLPGHFLLATRDAPPHQPRVFIDAFNRGELLDLAQCQTIVQGYGFPWSSKYVAPVSFPEVWVRMVNNLLHCHGSSQQFMEYNATNVLLAPRGRVVPYPFDNSQHGQMLLRLMQLMQQTGLP